MQILLSIYIVSCGCLAQAQRVSSKHFYLVRLVEIYFISWFSVFLSFSFHYFSPSKYDFSDFPLALWIPFHCLSWNNQMFHVGCDLSNFMDAFLDFSADRFLFHYSTEFVVRDNARPMNTHNSPKTIVTIVCNWKIWF